MMVLRAKRGGGKTPAAKNDTSTLKIKIRGKDDAPLTMQELREGFLDAARELAQYETGYRAKYATLYVTLVDEDGRPVRINPRNELHIYPYKTAAEDFGL